jgi:glycosyltransferase involved in cell wall biosynthesis
MNELISVIVPVYNVEKYLSRCVDSIINQTYKNLEIILVDDGSPDNCPAMCDEYVKKDSRIKVIHKENGGLSDARNAGMKVAKGDYIGFVDSDDWIELNMLERLLSEIIKNNCDVASCGVKMVWEDNSKKSRMLFPIDADCVIDGTENALDSLMFDNRIIQTVWNKIYKKSIIENILFPVGKINEDEYWSWRAIAKSKRVICLSEPMYNYVQRSGSIMRSNSFNPMCVIEAHCLRYNFIVNNYPNLQDKCCINLLYSCLYQAQRAKLLLEKEKYKEYYKEIKKVVKLHKPRKEALQNFSVKKKVRIKSIYNCFGLVCLIQNMLGIGNETNIS